MDYICDSYMIDYICDHIRSNCDPSQWVIHIMWSQCYCTWSVTSGIKENKLKEVEECIDDIYE